MVPMQCWSYAGTKTYDTCALFSVLPPPVADTVACDSFCMRTLSYELHIHFTRTYKEEREDEASSEASNDTQADGQ